MNQADRLTVPRTPYSVLLDWGDWKEFATFPEALAFYGTVKGYRKLINRDGYDCDCDDRGYFMCSDGLTEDERDEVEAVT